VKIHIVLWIMTISSLVSVCQRYLVQRYDTAWKFWWWKGCIPI